MRANVQPGERAELRRTLATALLLGLNLLLLGMLTSRSDAAVALLLEQPYGKLALLEPGGHSAIYLDHVCAETPLQLRPCHAGEMGVVLSRYDGIGDHDWIAMPVLPYLYAVTSADEIPDSIDRAGATQLREMYRRRYLEKLVPDRADGGPPGGNWPQLLGSAFDRTIYGFRVQTSEEQDARLIAQFNDRRNVEAYNGVWRNCADFARVTINRYYPHAVRRNFIADLGISSPKAVARGLEHYARKHPEVRLDVFVVPQVKGSLPRSHANVGVTEGVVKRYGLPLTLVSPVATAAFVVAYVGQGRFAMPRNAPLLNFSEVTGQPEISRPFAITLPPIPAPPRPSVRVATSATVAMVKPSIPAAGSRGR